MHWRRSNIQGNDFMMSRDDKVWIVIATMIVGTLIVFAGATMLWHVLR